MLALIFDFNGTMFFDEKFQEMSWREFIQNRIGREITKKEFEEYIHGRNADFTMQYFFKKSFSRDEIWTLEEEKESIYRELCLKSPAFCLAKGLPEFLDELTAQKVPFTIATASGCTNVKFFFKYLGLDKWFDMDKVVYNDGTLAGKPEPDFYLRAAEKLKAEIGSCIVFEDSQSGIEAARRAKAGGIIKVVSMRDSKADETLTGCIHDYTDRGLRTYFRYLFSCKF